MTISNHVSEQYKCVTGYLFPLFFSSELSQHAVFPVGYVPPGMPLVTVELTMF